MENLIKHCISSEASLKDGIIRINQLFNEVLCLFVIDNDQKLVGTLTDGDVRRALISDVSLLDSVKLAMKRDFVKVQLDQVKPEEIKYYRSKGVKLLPCVDESGKIIKVYDLEHLQSVLPIDAVLMAGGKGERLRPLTENTPKPLLKIGDKAIIDYNIDRLLQYGLDDIYVTVNYLAEQIEKHFSKSNKGIRIHCVREPKYLGTMGSVKFIRDFRHETVLIMNSDLFTNIDLEDFYANHMKHNADISVAAFPYSISVPYGILDMHEINIKGLHEKPTYNYYANAGIYLVNRKLFDLIPEDTFFDATSFIELLISKEFSVIKFPIIGYWIDIGKPEDYLKVKEFVKHLGSGKN